MRTQSRPLCCLMVILTVAPAHGQCYSAEEGYGSNPRLPEPRKSLFPTIDIAPAVGWADGTKPLPAEGLEVNAFSTGLDHPRWLYVLPNGDVLVAETNAPERPDDAQGVMGWVMGQVKKRAGAGAPSANRITLLRDADADGVAEVRSAFLENRNSPFGMALVGDRLYVADSDKLMEFPYVPGILQIRAAGRVVAPLPAGTINHHWTKNVIASRSDSLYVTVGSNSNIGERGMENERQRAAILEINPQNGQTTVFASGLRNPNGMDLEPLTGELWTVVNERDGIGDALVPDYLTSVRPGGFYGWPYSYFGANVDDRISPQDPRLVASAIKPDYALGAHTASLGLVFYTGTLLPESYHHGAFIGQHGSWNSSQLVGYRVIFVPFRGGKPADMPRDILTGFVDEQGRARGRPVGVAVDGTGALLVADDVGNRVWRVTPKH